MESLNGIKTEVDDLIKQINIIKKNIMGGTASINHEEEEKVIDMEVIQKFNSWIGNLSSYQGTYAKFKEIFDEQSRMDIYNYILNNQDDEILFYFEVLVMDLITNSKKYMSCLKEIKFDIENKTTNLKLIMFRHAFKCYIDEKFLFFIKENGNDYYLS
jgi:hypothetical protein